MTSQILNRVILKGFKSIKTLDLELKSLNVLIGANGAGKSNFINFFKFMNKLINQELQIYVAQKGGAESFLHFGSKQTEKILIHLSFPPYTYYGLLVPTQNDTLLLHSEGLSESERPLDEEGIGCSAEEYFNIQFNNFEKSNECMKSSTSGIGLQETSQLWHDREVKHRVNQWKIYHFHDTSDTARMKKTCSLHDNHFLREQGENLVAFLYAIKQTHKESYYNIIQTIRRIAPFFHDFILEPSKLNPEEIRLEWKHKYSDAYFNVNSLSDGTLRFMCLVTLLLQPNLPQMILLDEPELGLHPYAIQILASILKSIAPKTQIILSTQSVTLANQFEAEDIITVEQQDGESVFKRLSSEDIKQWLDDYQMGDIWEKNLIGANPL